MIEHFPKFKRENPRQSRRFTLTHICMVLVMMGGKVILFVVIVHFLKVRKLESAGMDRRLFGIVVSNLSTS